MNGLAEQSNVESIDDRLWNDIQIALDSIAQHAEDILVQWVVVGQRLIDLRRRNPGHGKASAFGAACLQRGIKLTPNQRSAAIWWAKLDDRQREVLREESPESFSPVSLQDRCRDKHPKWASTRNSSKSRSTGIGRNQGSEVTVPPPITLPETPKPKQPAAKPAPKSGPPIIMYGVQMWPVTDEDRARLGYYDYEQLAYAVKYFIGLRDIVMRAENDPHEIAVILRTRIRHLRKFVDKSPPSDCKTRMVRFCEVLERLPALLQANHAGECQPPSGKEFTEA